jgi:hypothetical protein
MCNFEGAVAKEGSLKFGKMHIVDTGLASSPVFIPLQRRKFEIWGNNLCSVER